MKKQDSILDVFIVTFKVKNYDQSNVGLNENSNRMTFGEIQTWLAYQMLLEPKTMLEYFYGWLFS